MREHDLRNFKVQQLILQRRHLGMLHLFMVNGRVHLLGLIRLFELSNLNGRIEVLLLVLLHFGLFLLIQRGPLRLCLACFLVLEGTLPLQVGLSRLAFIARPSRTPTRLLELIIEDF